MDMILPLPETCKASPSHSSAFQIWFLHFIGGEKTHGNCPILRRRWKNDECKVSKGAGLWAHLQGGPHGHIWVAPLGLQTSAGLKSPFFLATSRKHWSILYERMEIIHVVAAHWPSLYVYLRVTCGDVHTASLNPILVLSLWLNYSVWYAWNK